jgi:protein-disulfide isomerase
MIENKNLLLALLAGVVGGAISAVVSFFIVGTPGDASIRGYILKNPEILQEAASELDRREKVKRLAGAGSALTKPFFGAEAGNPNGDITLVEFTDYSCGYCRASVADVEKLTGEDKSLRVVYREIPILAPISRDAALWGLAAAKQGKHRAYHLAMFEGERPSPQSINTAAVAAGVDIAAAQAFVESAEAKTEIENNLKISQKLGFSGTPTFVVGDQIVDGAQGYDALKEAVAKARKAKTKAA